MEEKELILSYQKKTNFDVFFIIGINIFDLLKFFHPNSLLTNLHFLVEIGMGENLKLFKSEDTKGLTDIKSLIDFFSGIVESSDDLFVSELEMDINNGIGVVVKENAIDIIFSNLEKNNLSLIKELLNQNLNCLDNIINQLISVLLENQEKFVVVNETGSLKGIYNDLYD